jgi:hypothetical protein
LAQFSSADATAHALAHEAVTYLDHHAREAWFEWDLGVSSSGDDVKSGAYSLSQIPTLFAHTRLTLLFYNKRRRIAAIRDSQSDGAGDGGWENRDAGCVSLPG